MGLPIISLQRLLKERVKITSNATGGQLVVIFELLLGYPSFHAETPDAVFKKILSGVIQWPEFKNEEEEREFLTPEAKDLIEKLLVVDPAKRLGAKGIQEIKDHPYFKNVDWDHVYDEEASFVPTIDNPEDTDYFDLRGQSSKILETISKTIMPIFCLVNMALTPMFLNYLQLISLPLNHKNILSRKLSMSNTTNRSSNNSNSSVHDFGAHTPVNKLSIASVLCMKNRIYYMKRDRYNYYKCQKLSQSEEFVTGYTSTYEGSQIK